MEQEYREGRVTTATKIQGNWNSLLADPIAHTQVQPEKQLITTAGAGVVCTPPHDNALAPCSHKEADTWIFVHVMDAMFN